MSPRKEPDSLYDIAAISSIAAINSACKAIEMEYLLYDHPAYQYNIQLMRDYLFATLPSDLCQHLCSMRRSVPLNCDPRTQVAILLHPRLSVFRRCDLDVGISQTFWLKYLPSLKYLSTLNLRQICTDDILSIISKHCLLLQYINAISKVDLKKCSFNASVLKRNVSDTGLKCLTNLKYLRILVIDPPRNERLRAQNQKCISQDGIRYIVMHIPSLEDLRMESCDIGSTLVAAEFSDRPLNLRRLDRHFASSNTVGKLLKLCPKLVDINLTHLREEIIGSSDSEEILHLVAASDVKLCRLVLSFFPFTNPMRTLLTVKGSNLTDFALWEIKNEITADDILLIGKSCPNLMTLRLITRSPNLIAHKNLKCKEKIFEQLKYLCIGHANFNLENVLLFFMSHAKQLTNLTVTYQTKLFFDDILRKLLQIPTFKHMIFLSLDCSLTVTLDVIKQVIEQCHSLKRFMVNGAEDNASLQSYIKQNNFAVTLNSNY